MALSRHCRQFRSFPEGIGDNAIIFDNSPQGRPPNPGSYGDNWRHPLGLLRKSGPPIPPAAVDPIEVVLVER